MSEEEICLRRSELEAMIRAAAHDGARQALQEIGLGDEEAGDDVRDLRSLLGTYRMAKETAVKAFIRRIADLLFISILLGAAAKVGMNFMQH